MPEVEENPISSPKKDKSNKSNLLLIFLLMLSFSCIAYFVYEGTKLDDSIQKLKANEKKMKQENKDLVSLVDIDGSTGNLEKDLKQMLKQYDVLIEKDASKSDSLGMQKDRIMSLMNQISNLKKQKKITAKDLIEMKKENETLRGIMRGYIKEIDKLNTLNSELRSDLNRTETKLDSTSTERDKFKKEAELRNEQVKKGSVLSAYEFSSTGMRLKMNKTTTETNKARNTIQIKCAFQIGSNPISTAGEKTIYMQVLDVNSKTLQYRSNAIFTYQNETLPYSEKRTIDYQNKSINVSIYYDLRGEKLSKGVYKIKIFCDGSLIGTDTFALK